MNLELVQILTSIRIWSFKSNDGCRSDYFYIDMPCIKVECSNCPLFQSKSVAIYSNTIVKIISL